MSNLMDNTEYTFLGISNAGEHLYKLRDDIASKVKDIVDIKRKGGIITPGTKVANGESGKESIAPLTASNFIVGECGGPVLSIPDIDRYKSLLGSFGVNFYTHDYNGYVSVVACKGRDQVAFSFNLDGTFKGMLGGGIS